MRKTQTAATANLLGNCFVHPAVDYLAIGGGISLMVTFWLWFDRASADISMNPALLVLPLCMNGAHFAASTVRLYSKKSFFEDYPFLTFGFPLITLAFLTASIALSEFVGETCAGTLFDLVTFSLCSSSLWPGVYLRSPEPVQNRRRGKKLSLVDGNASFYWGLHCRDGLWNRLGLAGFL